MKSKAQLRGTKGSRAFDKKINKKSAFKDTLAIVSIKIQTIAIDANNKK